MFRTHLLLLAPLFLFVLGGCDDGVPSSTGEPTIEAEAFIQTLVELRKAALIRESGVLPVSERERILGAQGVSEDDLRHFVEVHGGNVPLMTRIWGHVETRMVEATYDEYRDGALP